MYLEHFGLRERPFSHTSDPRFIYLGDRHERALTHLQRCVQARGGIAHLVGPGGIGKTTMCRTLLSRLPERVDVALIPNPVSTRQEMLSVVCDELGVAYGKDAPSLLLGESLYRKQAADLGARRSVVIVDEAQSLSLDVLEQLCLLSSLEMDGQKLLEVILIGEPWLLDLLARVSPRQVSESAGHHLLPLTEAETCGYVRHRMATAGSAQEVFDADALREVHRLSSGVPSQINTICARALLDAVAQRRRGVHRAPVRAAGRAVLPPVGAPAIEVPHEAPRVERVKAPPKQAPRQRARPAAARARRPLWPWLVSGGLVLNAAVIAAVLLVPRPPDVAPTRTGPRADTETETPVVESATTPRPPTPPVAVIEEPVRSGRPPDVPMLAPPPVIRPPITPEAVRPVAPPASFAPAPSFASEETARQRRRHERTELGAVPAQPPVGNQVLPAQERQLKIDMLVWAAEPAARMVYVNGQRYVEGQTLENGAVLEHIEPDGIVVIQAGQRLRLRSEAR